MTKFILLVCLVIFSCCAKKKEFQQVPQISILALETFSSGENKTLPDSVLSNNDFLFESKIDSLVLTIKTSSLTPLNQISIAGFNCQFNASENGFITSNLGEILKRNGFTNTNEDILHFTLLPTNSNFTFSIQSFNSKNLYSGKNYTFIYR